MLHLASEILSKVHRKTLILGVIETCIILGLIAVLIFRSPAPEIKTVDNEKQYRDSITVIMKKYNAIEQDKIVLRRQNDSLQNVKTNIQIIYQYKIKYIEKANTNSLDSIIRGAW